jgi:site-specific DNA-methyltransferase (adenine-specific)
MIRIVHGDNLQYLQTVNDQTFDFIYIDPPFNTNKVQKLNRQRTVDGKVEIVSQLHYDDSREEYITWLQERLFQAHRVLKNTGSMLVHLDWREVHYVKVQLDRIFGRDNFINEIIWAYDYGAKQKNKWPTKHDNILFYAKDHENYTFNHEEMWRLEYMAPGLAGEEKAAKGKVCTDVIFHTICPTQGKERTGYPTQKPLKLIKKLIEVHTKPGDLCLDFFAGSGTTGEACVLSGRDCVLVDSNMEAIEVMVPRLRNEKTILEVI